MATRKAAPSKAAGRRAAGTKAAGTKAAGTKATGTKAAGTKAAGTNVVAGGSAKKVVNRKKPATAAAKKSAARSMPKAGRDPQGGLTAKGREFFNEKQGSHLRPGVRGKADTPEKMVRKGSFLRRHFAHPRGPMVDEKGEPTRLALSAHAWGEPVPKTLADAKKLARKGHQLLEKYHQLENAAAGKRTPGRGPGSGVKRAVKKVAN